MPDGIRSAGCTTLSFKIIFKHEGGILSRADRHCTAQLFLVVDHHKYYGTTQRLVPVLEKTVPTEIEENASDVERCLNEEFARDLASALKRILSHD